MSLVSDVLETELGLPSEWAGPIGDVLTFVVSLVVIYYVAKSIAGPVLDRVMRTRNMDMHARRPITKLVNILIAFGAITLAFGFAGYPNFLQSLATIAAAATLAIGFALQDVIRNFVAGVFIYTDKPFRIGDWIEWDGNSGTVEDISFRVTRVRTFDNELLTVPNSNLTDGVIKNPVEGNKLRLKFVFGIGYGDDVDAATEIIREEAEEHPEIMEDPEPSVRLVELGDSDVGLQSRIWIDDPSRSDFVRIRGEYVQAVKERFDGEGIEIPYPTRTLEGGLDLSGAPDAREV